MKLEDGLVWYENDSISAYHCILVDSHSALRSMTDLVLVLLILCIGCLSLLMLPLVVIDGDVSNLRSALLQSGVKIISIF
jgi:hypothetical protein